MALVGLLVLMPTAALNDPSSSLAQSPIPTPTAEGCDQIGEYLKERDEVDRQTDEDWSSIFPSSTVWSEISEDEIGTVVMAADAEELEAIGGMYDRRVEQLERIDAPGVIAYYHDQLILRNRLTANMYHNGATTGVLVALIAFSEPRETAYTNLVNYAAAAVSVCPQFDEIKAQDRLPAPATPEPA